MSYSYAGAQALLSKGIRVSGHIAFGPWSTKWGAVPDRFPWALPWESHGELLMSLSWLVPPGIRAHLMVK